MVQHQVLHQMVNQLVASSKSNLKVDFLKLPEKKLQKSYQSFSIHKSWSILIQLGAGAKIYCLSGKQSPARIPFLVRIFSRKFRFLFPISDNFYFTSTSKKNERIWFHFLKKLKDVYFFCHFSRKSSENSLQNMSLHFS